MAGGRKMTLDFDVIAIDKRMKQVVKALEKQDKDAMKRIFSKQAVEEAVDFEENLDLLYAFFEEGSVLWERSGGPGTSEHLAIGHALKEIEATYDIECNNQQYHASIKICTKNDDNPDNIGILSFCIIPAEKWTDRCNYWGNLDICGITVD